MEVSLVLLFCLLKEKYASETVQSAIPKRNHDMEFVVFGSRHSLSICAIEIKAQQLCKWLLALKVDLSKNFLEFSFSYLFVWIVSLWIFIFFPLQMSLCQTSGHHLKLSWAHPSQVKTSRIMLPGRRRGQGFQMCGNIIIQLVILNAVVNMVRSHEGGYPWKTRLLVKGNKSWTNLEVIIRNGVWSNSHLPLLRTSAQVVKKSISVFNNSLFWTALILIIRWWEFYFPMYLSFQCICLSVDFLWEICHLLEIAFISLVKYPVS